MPILVLISLTRAFTQTCEKLRFCDFFLFCRICCIDMSLFWDHCSRCVNSAHLPMCPSRQRYTALLAASRNTVNEQHRRREDHWHCPSRADQHVAAPALHTTHLVLMYSSLFTVVAAIYNNSSWGLIKGVLRPGHICDKTTIRQATTKNFLVNLLIPHSV